MTYDPLDLGRPEREWPLPAHTFEPMRTLRLPNPQSLDRDGLVAYYASMGWVADLPDETRLPLLDRVRSRLRAPKYRRLWETEVHWTRLRVRRSRPA